jgi:NAD(P)-dependent dehydrogenase (short-subunit alcohol dehydrogenase family)
VIWLAFGLATELARDGITALALTPGFLRSEAMLDGFEVREENWRDAIPKARGFEESETPCYVGRAVAALAADPKVHAKTGQVMASWTLAKEYGFRDVDGRQPDWGAYVEKTVHDILDRGNPTDGGDRSWVTSWHIQLKDDPRFRELIERIEAVLEL